MTAVVDDRGVSIEPAPSLLVPFTVASAFFMEGLDSTIVGTSLPQIARSFGVSAPEISGAITSYLLSLAVFIPISGWVADRFGARRVYCGAIVVFTLGSILCGLSLNEPELVGSRMLQGLGGALMIPIGRLILARAFPRDQLVRAMSYMIVPGLIGPMIGPVLGGFITTVATWRWIFLINVPVGLVGIALALRFIRPIPTPAPARFDVPGFVLAGAGFASLQLGLGRLQSHAHGLAPPLLAATAAAAFVLYVLHCRRCDTPVLDPRLLRIRTFTVSTFVGGLSRLATGGGTFLLPLLFQLGFGYSPLHSGLLTFMAPVGSIALRAGFTRVLERLGVQRLLMANAAILTVMLADFAIWRPGLPDWAIGTGLFAFGLVQSAQFSTLGALNFSGLASEMTSRATSFAAVAQRFAMSIGIALAAIVLAAAAVRRAAGVGDFRPAFLALAALEAVCVAGFLCLRPGDGADLTRSRRA